MVTVFVAKRGIPLDASQEERGHFMLKEWVWYFKVKQQKIILEIMFWGVSQEYFQAPQI